MILLNHSRNKTQTAAKGLSALPPSYSEKQRKKDLINFQKEVKVKFKNLALLHTAFIHRSASNETNSFINNEKLEFLGDAILGAVVASLLYDGFPEQREGYITKIKAVVVSEDVLSEVSLRMRVNKMLILGHGEENSGGRQKKAILADALEALFGALYIDSGYKKTFEFISACLAPEIKRIMGNPAVDDFKSRFQEACQRKWKVFPVYGVTKVTGPEHDKVFWVEVKARDTVLGSGSGKNKKSAEQEAARMALGAMREEKAGE